MSSRRYCARAGLVPKTPKSPATRAKLCRLKPLLAGLILLAAQRVMPADEISIEPIDAQAITKDGAIWTIDPSSLSNNASRFQPNPLERRGVLECSLNDIPAEAVILSATIWFDISDFTGPTNPPVIEFHGYTGNGILEVTDATVPFNLLGQSPPITSLEVYSADLDPAYIQTLIGSGAHLGLMTYQQTINRQASFWSVEGFGDTLAVIIEYDPNVCIADLNDDGVVGPNDLALVLGFWGENPGHPSDLDGDGIVGPQDLAIVLGNWGPC